MKKRPLAAALTLVMIIVGWGGTGCGRSHPSREALVDAIRGMPRPADAWLDPGSVKYEPGCQTGAECFTYGDGSRASMEIHLKGTPVQMCLAVLRALTSKNLRATVALETGDLSSGVGETTALNPGDYLLDEATCETGRVHLAHVLHPDGKVAGPGGIAFRIVLPRHERFDVTGWSPLSPKTASYEAYEADNTWEHERPPQPIPAEMRALLVGVLTQPITIAARPHLWRPSDHGRTRQYVEERWIANLARRPRTAHTSATARDTSISVAVTCDQAGNTLLVAINDDRQDRRLMSERKRTFDCTTGNQQQWRASLPVNSFRIDVIGTAPGSGPLGRYRVTVSPA